MLRSVPAGLSIAALVAWVPTIAALSAERPTPTQDIVPITAVQRQALVVTMNTNLRGYAAILAAAGRGDAGGRSDAAALTAAAQALDANRGTERDPTLRAVLPDRWLQLGGLVHRGFAQLATDAPALGPREVAARLGTITATCAECHATYAWPR